MLWRVMLRVRRGPLRVGHELTVTMLFLWCLGVVSVAFFPMHVIFYDWHGTISLRPFASSLDLIRNASPDTVVKNIGGNILMFVPFGVLMPILFERLRRFRPLVIRAVIASAAIELLQMPTQVHATDVDDLILNTLGACLGFGLFRLGSRLLPRPAGEGGRLESRYRGEPMLAGILPLALAIAITSAVLLRDITGATLSEQAMVAHATSERPNAVVLAREEVGASTFLLVASRPGPSGTLHYASYKKVLPGRHTWTATGDPIPVSRSRFGWSVTAYNPTEGEMPIIVVWGRNEVAATRLEIEAPGLAVRRDIGRSFLIAFEYDARDDAADGLLDELRFSFRDAQGRDLTHRFAHP